MGFILVGVKSRGETGELSESRNFCGAEDSNRESGVCPFHQEDSHVEVILYNGS